MRGNRAVVDDPTAAWSLVFHDPESLLGAQERPGQIGGNYRIPGRYRQLLQGHGRRRDAGIVEQYIEASERTAGPGKQCLHGGRIAHIADHGKAVLAAVPGRNQHRAQWFLPAPRQHHPEAIGQKRQRHRATDAAARSRDHRHPQRCTHHALLQRLFGIVWAPLP